MNSFRVRVNDFQPRRAEQSVCITVIDRRPLPVQVSAIANLDVVPAHFLLSNPFLEHLPPTTTDVRIALAATGIALEQWVDEKGRECDLRALLIYQACPRLTLGTPMGLHELLSDIHALEQELLAFKRQFGRRSCTRCR